MKIFIFENVSEVTDRYHEDGGLAVIAKDKDHVVELLEINRDEVFCPYGYTKLRATLTDEDWKNVVVYELKNEEEPKIFVFPDAGCC